MRTLIGRAGDFRHVAAFAVEPLEEPRSSTSSLRIESTGCIGWHLSNGGGAERVRRKYESVFEAGDVQLVPNVEKAISECTDVIQRTILTHEHWERGRPFQIPQVLSSMTIWARTGLHSRHWRAMLLDGNVSYGRKVVVGKYEVNLRDPTF